MKDPEVVTTKTKGNHENDQTKTKARQDRLKMWATSGALMGLPFSIENIYPCLRGSLFACTCVWLVGERVRLQQSFNSPELRRTRPHYICSYVEQHKSLPYTLIKYEKNSIFKVVRQGLIEVCYIILQTPNVLLLMSKEHQRGNLCNDIHSDIKQHLVRWSSKKPPWNSLSAQEYYLVSWHHLFSEVFCLEEIKVVQPPVTSCCLFSLCTADVSWHDDVHCTS